MPQRVSLCMIARDEEANLAGCLAGVADLVQEVVLVDTGSRDRTREVAARFGARVHDFPWVDDFAAARNETLRHATGDWVFWMDADDRLGEADRRKLRTLFAALAPGNDAYNMTCRSLLDPVTNTTVEAEHVRLFRHAPEIRWQYRLHETVLPALHRLGAVVHRTNVVIGHLGYHDPALLRQKGERNLRLLLRDHAEHPDDPHPLFHLGGLYQFLGKPAEALPLLQQSLERARPENYFVREIYGLLVTIRRQLGQPHDALAVCRIGRARYPDDALLEFHEGSLLLQLGDLAGAEARLTQLLGGRWQERFCAVAADLLAGMSYHLLAVVCRARGDVVAAEDHWCAALTERPDYGQPWLGLGALCLEQGRWQDFGRVLGRLTAGAPDAPEVAGLKALGYVARGQGTAARQVLEHQLHRHPETLDLRVALDGLGTGADANVLRDLLKLDPARAGLHASMPLLLRPAGGEGEPRPADRSAAYVRGW